MVIGQLEVSAGKQTGKQVAKRLLREPADLSLLQQLLYVIKLLHAQNFRNLE